MVRPIGGRGKRAPYDTTQVRVPIPIKSAVEKLIAVYRESVLLDEADDRDVEATTNDLTEFLTALKLVDRYVKEIQQTEHLYDPKRRNNYNLARFRDWLISQTRQ